MNKKTIFLREDEDYITLQTLLKMNGIISTGGMAKVYLANNDVYVNDIEENRRGRKLYSGDKIRVADTVFEIQNK